MAHPDDVVSFIAVEAGVAGFGLETFADVGKGGAWYIGALATPGVPETFLKGRAQNLMTDFIFRLATIVPDAVSPADVTEFARGFEREGGWSGAHALYGSMLREGEDVKALVAETKLMVPTLAVDRAGSDFTFRSIDAVSSGATAHASIEGVGHYIALEAPDRLAAALTKFVAGPP